MKYYLVSVCFFCMVHVTFAERLSKNPHWKIKPISSAILVGDCGEGEVKKISDKIIEISAYVYTIESNSPLTLKKYKICHYNKGFNWSENIDDFNFNKNKCNKPYKIYIYSKTDNIDIKSIFKSTSDVPLNYDILPKDGTKTFFFPNTLKTLTLGTYVSGIPAGAKQKYKTNYFCDAYFDSIGYAYLEYNKPEQCDVSPKKPKFPGESNPSPKKNATSSPTKPAKKVKIGSDTFIYNSIYGYVLYNKYFNINIKNFNDALLTSVAFVKKNKSINFSPVVIDDEKTLWFNLVVSADFLILFKNNSPEFIYKKAYMLSIDNIDRGYKLEKLNKYIVLKSEETYNLLKKHIALQNKLYLIDNALSTLKNAKEFYSKIQIPIKEKYINSFTHDKNNNWYKLESKDGNYAVIDREYYLEKKNNQWSIKSPKTNFSLIAIDIPKMPQEEKFKIKKKKEKEYIQTPIIGKDSEYIFEIIEPKTEKPFSKGKQFSG